MTVKMINCKILAGKRGTNALQRMHALGDKHGSVDTTPWKFWCSSCRTEYEGMEISVGVDLHTVSCSNCYGDNMWITSIRIKVPEVVNQSVKDDSHSA